MTAIKKGDVFEVTVTKLNLLDVVVVFNHNETAYNGLMLITEVSRGRKVFAARVTYVPLDPVNGYYRLERVIPIVKLLRHSKELAISISEMIDRLDPEGFRFYQNVDHVLDLLEMLTAKVRAVARSRTYTPPDYPEADTSSDEESE